MGLPRLPYRRAGTITLDAFGHCFRSIGCVQAEACAADCSIALELDPGRVKAYFRRALAREQLGDDANALRDARRVLEVRGIARLFTLSGGEQGGRV